MCVASVGWGGGRHSVEQVLSAFGCVDRKRRNRMAVMVDAGAKSEMFSVVASLQLQFLFVLLAETVADREEVETPLLVELPDVGFLD